MFLIFWTAVRILAALVAAFVGWVTVGLAVGLLVRLIFRRPAPRPAVFLARIVGALALGLLVYYFLYPGGVGGWGLGGGGFGLGGGGTGRNGSGTGTSATSTTPKIDKASTHVESRDTLTIEMLGGERYKGEGRYYLVEGKAPPRTLDELTDLLKRNRGRYRKLEILIYPDSVAREHPATSQLAGLANRFGLSLSITRTTRGTP